MDSASDNVTDSEVCGSESKYVTESESEFETSDSKTNTSTGVEDCEKPQSNAELLQKKKAVENAKQKVQDGLLLAAQGLADLEECLVDSDLVEALRKSLEVPKMMEDIREEIRSRKCKQPEPENHELQAMQKEHNEQEQRDQDLTDPQVEHIEHLQQEEEPAPQAEQQPEEEPTPQAEQQAEQAPVPQAKQQPKEEPMPQAEQQAEQAPAPQAEQQPEEEPMPQAEQQVERPWVKNLFVDKKRIYECSVCGHQKKSYGGIHSHIKKEHTKDFLVCDRCNFRTTNMDSLRNHKCKRPRIN